MSDGIFAFAATVLMLDFRSPEPADIHSEAELLSALLASAHRLMPWLLSLLDARHLLGRPTDPAQPARALEPRPDLAAPRRFSRSSPYCRSRRACWPISSPIARLSDLLGQHFPSWRGRLRHLGLCRTGEADPGRRAPGAVGRVPKAGHHRPVALRRRARSSASSACRSGSRLSSWSSSTTPSRRGCPSCRNFRGKPVRAFSPGRRLGA